MITNGTVVSVTVASISPPGTDPYLIGDGVVLRVVAGTVFLRRTEAVAALERCPVPDRYEVAQRVDAINHVRKWVSDTERLGRRVYVSGPYAIVYWRDGDIHAKPSTLVPRA